MPLRGAQPHRLPTVEMYHKKSGKTRIVNATVYAAEYLSNPNWTTQSPKVSGYRDGGVSVAAVLDDQAEYEENKRRLLDPIEAKKRGDLDRAYDAKKITVRTKLKEPVDWRALPWFKRRLYVKEETGTAPNNKAHAEELMKGK